MEYEEEDGGNYLQRRPKIRAPFTTYSHIYKNVIMRCIITKVPLWVQNASPIT